MARRPSEALIRSLGLIAMSLCMVGAVAAIVVVLVRVPVLANTKLELLFGTLQGVAVGLLFAIAALLINLTLMLRGATHQLAVGPTNTGAQMNPSSGRIDRLSTESVIGDARIL